MADNLQTDSDGITRCSWCGDKDDYIAYHDDEWGLPMGDDKRLFEKIVLEGFQSGLSWLTILRKRENFRRAFAGFDAAKVARFNAKDIERLVTDAGIVRHRGKIEAAINNGRAAIEMIEAEGSLAAYFWRFEDRGPFPGFVAQTDTSKRLSKDLKKRGWRFVGPTTAYAFMQAMGLVNDHVPGCDARDRIEAARAAFTPPT